MNKENRGCDVFLSISFIFMGALLLASGVIIVAEPSWLSPLKYLMCLLMVLFGLAMVGLGGSALLEVFKK